MASSDRSSAPRPVPGSYGLPVIGAVRDRLDFYYFQGQDKYFDSRVERYGSTVVRINVPPGPFMARDPRVVALLDAKSFPVLFDVTKVKQLLFSLLQSRKDAVVPTFRSNFSALFSTVESQLAAKEGGNKVEFNKLNDATSFDFIGEAYFGVRPSTTDLGSDGPSKAAKWLLWQLHPLVTLGLPMIIEEPLLHTFHLPSFLVSGDYKALYSYFSTAASQSRVLDTAQSLGLSREEACHNLLFATTFNSYGGLKVLFPGLLAGVANAGQKLHSRLANEIRAAVAEAGGKVTLAAVEKMELVKSVVWESLRLDPPVKFQYGHAKTDMQIESHDGVLFQVNKGEMLFGYQPCATKDARVFGPTAREFVGDRFLGEKGKKLLKYVYWSNGRETENPSVDNKQCPGKNFVVLVGRLFLVELFLRYDTFTAEVGTELLGAKVVFTGVTKATSGPGTA
ncbi:hypothetical protein PR202_gb19103 [Eleusine coracana subsp. coracana]|uniref:hydroperoxide dehydratase n=1 Tax=Eleusine coracana subsp. coracana TaxID=191504 RepID=A0AAV5F6Q6_ELECO|nr:hypothetical protein PR202_gb19103 [Eleusine coracana subsp. coracana]